MKIAIVGPGAVGCLLAGLLKSGGTEVCLVDKNKKRAAYISKSGLKISGLKNLRVKVEVFSDYKKTPVAELVIFTVKSYDLERAAKHVKNSPLGKALFFMGLQNGLGNIEILSRIFGKKKVLAGVTNLGATLLAAGNCRYAGAGKTFLGALSPAQKPVLKKIKKTFCDCGIDAEISNNIEGAIWGKLIVNVGINAITVVCGIKNGGILKNKEARKLQVLLVKEGVSVARKLKIKLPYADAVKYTESVCRKTAGNISSMLQDVRNGKKTEIDFINGAVVKEAKRLKMFVPYNEVVTSLVKGIE